MIQKPEHHSHCHACGSPQLEWNKERNTAKCCDCGEFTYLNPPPVANLIIPHLNGVILQRRGNPNEQGYGKFSLPGGFILIGESWQDAAAREAWEEVQVKLHSAQRDIKHLLTESIPSGNQLIVFGVVVSEATKRVDDFKPSLESTERTVITPQTFWKFRDEIAFPLHVKALGLYFGIGH